MLTSRVICKAQVNVKTNFEILVFKEFNDWIITSVCEYFFFTILSIGHFMFFGPSPNKLSSAKLQLLHWSLYVYSKNKHFKFQAQSWKKKWYYKYPSKEAPIARLFLAPKEGRSLWLHQFNQCKRSYS